ncbi:hypothetical protein ACJX0J_020267, partial [Zea mays]
TDTTWIDFTGQLLICFSIQITLKLWLVDMLNVGREPKVEPVDTKTYFHIKLSFNKRVQHSHIQGNCDHFWRSEKQHSSGCIASSPQRRRLYVKCYSGRMFSKSIQDYGQIQVKSEAKSEL